MPRGDRIWKLQRRRRPSNSPHCVAAVVPRSALRKAPFRLSGNLVPSTIHSFRLSLAASPKLKVRVGGRALLLPSRSLKECNPSSVFKCCRDVGIDYRVASDIHELNQKLDRIIEEGERLHVEPVMEDQIKLDQIRSDLDFAPDLEPDIVGREVENDCDSLIELLIKRDDIPSHPTRPSFAIIGTIGVGKTTLARKVYRKTETFFEPRVWVHVSKDLRHMTMWSGERFSKGETAGQQALLRTWLQGNKFLLVIDDVWGENVWDGLLEIQAQHGSPGSRVLITTRNERVARRMGAVHLHHVKGLNEDDGWWLLSTRAFLDENTGNMQDIEGSVIDRQCITQQWIAEGFIVTQQNTAVEEEAKRCYEELLGRGLLLPENQTYGAERSKMPHLFRSFALLQSQDEYFIGNPQDIGDALRPCRLTITTGGAEAIRNGIRKLKSLRTIILCGSPLNDRILGDIFQKFTHLRVLDLGDTQIECVARSLGSMMHLRYLSFANTQGFLVSPRGSENRNGWPFQELRSLYKLTSLKILRLERILTVEDAAQSALEERQHLKELELCSSTDDGTTEISRAAQIKDVFEALKPGPSIVSLKLENYYGHGFPSWLDPFHLRELSRLTLHGCLHCQYLPSLGQMKNLKFLAINGSNLSTRIGHEIRGTPDDGVAFPKLEQLVISKMSNLKSWKGLEKRDMPSLMNFRICGCPKLDSLPSWLKHCMALRSLHIDRADNLEAIENIPALKELEVCENNKLKVISNLGKLENLKVVACLLLDVVQDVPLLRTVHSNEKNSIKLPQWLQPEKPFMLRRLEIVGTEELLDSCSSATAPYWPVIQNADHVYANLPDGSFYFSYAKSSSYFHKSARNLARSSLQSSASFSVPILPQAELVSTDEIRNINEPTGQSSSRSWMRMLFTVLLFVAAHIFSLSSEY
ncbi:unnamed protein product [Miscanthus lutarioriparius]|uniref:AAA+ ATPase domain-containing protein n=1 Tax=Miscanthus lutarioriparius TaxID=422564 RepID=A0A811NEJ6_9POAL|nr:unnamed protein product [Miscanthus lutarioriparius]